MKNQKRKAHQSVLIKRALIPDLLALPPEDLQIEKRDVNGRTRTLLLLSQSFANIGRGRLQVRRGNSTSACPGKGRARGYQDIFLNDGTIKSYPLKECMVYHPIHRHWHVANIARYDLCEVDPETGGPGKVLSTSDKISFCLVDEYRVDADHYRGPRYPERYVSCHTRISGVSPGWMDEYDYKTYGQWINITGIEDGTYFVKTTVNPNRLLIESSYRNNEAWVKVRISDGGDDITILD